MRSNLNRLVDEAQPDRQHLRLVAQPLAGTALAGTKEDGAEHTAATTATERAVVKKSVRSRRARVDHRPAIDVGMPFDMGRK